MSREESEDEEFAMVDERRISSTPDEPTGEWIEDPNTGRMVNTETPIRNRFDEQRKASSYSVAIQDAVAMHIGYFQTVFRNRNLNMMGYPTVMHQIRGEAIVDGERRNVDVQSGTSVLPVDVNINSRGDLVMVFEEKGLIQTMHFDAPIDNFSVDLKSALKKIPELRDIFTAIIDDDMMASVAGTVTKAIQEVKAEKDAKAQEHYQERWGKYA